VEAQDVFLELRHYTWLSQTDRVKNHQGALLLAFGSAQEFAHSVFHHQLTAENKLSEGPLGSLPYGDNRVVNVKHE
jgi:hypothetical protein